MQKIIIPVMFKSLVRFSVLLLVSITCLSIFVVF